MYFVRIDLAQLYTRLMNSTIGRGVDLQSWLHRQGFRPTGNGFCGTADSMNCLSCSEILFSERLDSAVAAARLTPAVSPYAYGHHAAPGEVMNVSPYR
jgi:hypothetical protein